MHRGGKPEHRVCGYHQARFRNYRLALSCLCNNMNTCSRFYHLFILTSSIQAVL